MRIFITFWIALILISKIFLLFFNQGVSLIDDFFVLFCFYFFLKELFNHDRKRLSFLISFFIWLSATFTISVFLGSKGYISSVLVYLKPIVFITGILVFMRKEYIDFRMIEVIIIISSLYGILQFLIYLFFGYIMPGGGQALHHIGGRWFLRVGGMSGHPNIYGMLLFPFVPVFFVKKKYVEFCLVFIALILSMSRWPIFLGVLLAFIIVSKKYKIIMVSSLITMSLFFAPKILTEYKEVYRNYNKENTLKLYGMEIGKKIFMQNMIFGVGIGNFGSKYSRGSDVYCKYGFSNRMYSMLKGATSGIESGITIIFVENGWFLGLLYLCIVFQAFMTSHLVIIPKFIFLFYGMYIGTLIFYNQYIPEFIISLLISMFVLSHFSCVKDYKGRGFELKRRA